MWSGDEKRETSATTMVGGIENENVDVDVEKSHKHKGLQICHTCGLRFKAGLTFVRHWAEVHGREQQPGQEDLNCAICGQITFGGYSGLLNHVKKFHHSPVLAALPTTNRVDRDNNNHVVVVKQQQPLAHPLPGFLVPKLPLARTGTESVVGKKQLQVICGSCHTTVNNDRELSKHRAVHHDWTKCAACGQNFAGSLRLTEHWSLMHNQPSLTQVYQVKPTVVHQCQECSYTTGQGSSLARHTESFHTSVACKICQKEWEGRKKLKEHIRRDHHLKLKDYFHHDEEDDTAVEPETNNNNNKHSTKTVFIGPKKKRGRKSLVEKRLQENLDKNAQLSITDTTTLLPAEETHSFTVDPVQAEAAMDKAMQMFLSNNSGPAVIVLPVHEKLAAWETMY